MKKIIYSLVIMIAAGSLFTSCVNYDEPVGVQDLREAKASYLDALSGLRAADAEVQKAVAAFTNAQAEVEKANAAYRNAQAEGLKLDNETKEIANAQAKAEADKAIAQAKAEAEIAAVNYQNLLAQAQAAFEKELKKIAAEALSLTAEEKNVIQAAINYYNAALTAYNNAANEVASKEQALWNAKYAYTDNMDKEAYVASLKDTIAAKKAIIAENEAWKEKVNTDPNVEAWQAYVDGLKAEAQKAAFDTNTMRANQIILSSTTLKDAKAAAEKAWETWKEANEPDAATEQTVTYNEDDELTPEVAANADWFKTLVESYAKTCAETNNTWTWKIDNGTTEQVEKFLNGAEDGDGLLKSGFNGVINVIKNSKLVDADSANATEVARLKKAYDVADSTYKANLATIKAGRKAFIDSNKAVIAAIADTLAKADTLKWEKDTLKLATAAVDSIYSIDTINARNLVKARKALAQAAKAIQDEGLAGSTSYSTADVDSVLKAIKDFVAAKQDVFGAQATDTLKYYELVGGSVQEKSQAIKDLELEDLAQQIDSVCLCEGIYYFGISNKFTRLVKKANALDGYAYNSYEAQTKIRIDGAPYGDASWNGYDALNPNPVLTSAQKSSILLSKPNLGNSVLTGAQPDDVFSVIFEALGLTVNFWDDSWADYVLTDSDPWEKFEISVKGIENPMYITVDTANFKFNVAKTIDPKVAYQPQTYTAAVDAKDAAQDDVDEATTALVAAKGKVTEKQAAAQNAFATIVNSFFGVDTWTTNFTKATYATVTPAQWKSTFDDVIAEKIENFEYCVEKIDPYAVYEVMSSSLNFNSENSEYQDVIKSLLAHYTGLTEIEVKALVFGTASASQYDKMKAAFYAYEIAKNQPDIVKYFEAVQAWAKGLEEAKDAAVAANKEYNESLAAYKEAAFGIKKVKDDGTIKYNKEYFVDGYDENEGPAAGQQKAIYDQYLAEVVGKIAKLNADIETLKGKVTSINALVESANEAAIKAVAVANLKDANALNEANKDFAKAVENLIAKINGNITTAQNRIDNCEWEIAQLEAGVAQNVVNEKAAERNLEAAKAALAEAEQVLKLAKAEYDAVLAKYIK